MKKVLFATSALVAVAGMAAADVSLGGSARIGLVYFSGTSAVAATGTAADIATAKLLVTSTAATAASTAATAAGGSAVTGSADAAANAAFAAAAAVAALDAIDGTASVGSRVRVEKRLSFNVDGSAETDGGLSMGGRIRLRSNEGEGQSDSSSGNVWIGTDMWRVTVGNTSGAMVYRQGFFQGSVGLTGLQWANVGFNIGSSRWTLATYSSSGNAGDVVRLDLNMGDFGVSVSTDTTASDLSAKSENSIAVAYNFGDWNVSGGFADEAATGLDTWAITAGGAIGDFGVGIQYVDKKTIGSKVVLNGSFDFGDTTVTAFIADTNEDTVGSAGIGLTGSDTEYGVGFTSSLGGATLAGGISRNYKQDTMADLGIRWGW